MIVKPKHLIDLKKITSSVFSKKELRLDLRETKLIKIPIFKLFKIGALFVVCSYLVFGSALAPIDKGQLSMAAQNEEERKQLEILLESYDREMIQIQATIDQYRGQGKSLESEVKRLNAQMTKLNLQVKATTLSLKKLDDEIAYNNIKIKTTESDIEKNKRVLAYTLQNIYSSGDTSMVEVFLKNFEVSDFFDDIKSLTDVQNNLRLTLERVTDLKTELIDTQEILVMKKNDVDSLKKYQITQQLAINSTKTEKANLLKETKGQESKYQELLQETKKTAAEIRSKIFKLFGGGELPFPEAVKIAQLAEKATGMRAPFILAILTQESAIDGVIGANLGGCYYNQANKCISGKTVMRDSQKGAFLALLSEIKNDSPYIPDNAPISCAICAHGNYGGAMGPSQFMPTTWAIYAGFKENGSGVWEYNPDKDYIGRITGNKPSSPWRNADAFVATALYVKDLYNSSACVKYANDNKNISPIRILQERCAAAKYYAGGNWFNYRWFYGDPVAKRADVFAEEIEILDAD